MRGFFSRVWFVATSGLLGGEVERVEWWNAHRQQNKKRREAEVVDTRASLGLEGVDE